MKSFSRCVLGSWLVATLAAVPAGADWRWSVTPYFWASDIGADVSVDDHEVSESRVEFNDVLDSLDWATQVHVEGQRGRHGLMFDVTYLDLGDDDRLFTLAGPVGGTVIVKGDLETTILEVGGLFNPRGDGRGVSVLYGARMYDIDQEIDARYDLPGSLPDPSRRYAVSKTFYDALLGARYVGAIGQRGSFVLRADVSAGGTELTWNSWVGLGWEIGAKRNKTIFAGYRYMEVEFEEADRRAEIEAQQKMGGPIVGFRMAF